MIDAINIRYTVDEDKWYKYKGVKPPERTPHGIVEDDVEGMIRKINDHVHIWKQKGKGYDGSIPVNEMSAKVVLKTISATNKEVIKRNAKN